MGLIREIKNWLYIKKTIKQEIKKHDSKWYEYNLRINRHGRVYTVVNLREEDMGDPVEVQQFKAMEKMKPINQYLSDLDFTELVFPSIELIPESRSYLVVYSPIFNILTWRNVIKWSLISLISIGLIGTYIYA